jgi:hypothetical protein
VASVAFLLSFVDSLDFQLLNLHLPFLQVKINCHTPREYRHSDSKYCLTCRHFLFLCAHSTPSTLSTVMITGLACNGFNKLALSLGIFIIRSSPCFDILLTNFICIDIHISVPIYKHMSLCVFIYDLWLVLSPVVKEG